MKAYKGFNKDMTCREFQFKKGKTYHEDKAELCKSGFHACENPLDCFAYYVPANSVYHEVELDEVSEEKGDDSKVCGKTIKIGAELDVLGICKAHFEYVKSKTILHREAANDWSSLSANDRSSLSANDRSSLSANNWSSLSANNRSSLSANDRSSLSANDCSSLSANNWSSLSANDWSSLSANDRSSLSANDWSSLSANNWSSLSANNWSSLSAQDGCKLSAGKDCVIAAFNSKAKAKEGTLIALANRVWNGNRYVITDFKAAIVDGKTLKPDTWYKLENGEFVEVCNEKEDNG